MTLPTTIWVLLTQAPGDNDQSLALLEAIDRPAEIKRLDWPVTDIAEDRTVARALLSETPEAQQWRASLGLCAPWPRLVICCGRRADRVAFWIKEQSGGYTKIVSIGRARMPVAAYDLLIAPPPFLVPERANVVRLPLPLTRRRSLATGGTTTGAATIPVPKPWFTILLGGQVKQFAASKQVLTEAARLAQLAARQHGGSVVISTSRRTPPALLAAVESVLERPHIYRWSADGKTGNPYETLLRESAALFVTADSVSMILDCCASGTPSYVIEYPERLDFRARLRRGLFRHVRRVIDRFNAWGLQETGDRLDHAQEWLHARRILRYPRDLRQIHASVYGMGLAHPLSEFDPAALPQSRRPANDLVEASGTRAIAARCRALLQPSALAAE